MNVSENEKKVLIFVAAFSAIFLNMHRLLPFLSPDSIPEIGIPWHFNLPELIFQTGFHFLFCYLVGFYNLKMFSSIRKMSLKKWGRFILINTGFLTLFLLVGINFQQFIFNNTGDLTLFRLGYFVRFIWGASLMGVLVKFLSLYRKQRIKEIENERLKTAYYNAELQNLRAQINPHFLFNSFANLSSLIREDVEKSQLYLGHLSKVFRNSLSDKNKQLITLREEMELLDSNIQLLKIKHEEALSITINVDGFYQKKVPHMSLQPLLENALKHNHVSLKDPIYIEIYIENEQLFFKNTRKQPKYLELSTGIGLYNLNERYKILGNTEITINKDENYFVVTLPLL